MEWDDEYATQLGIHWNYIRQEASRLMSEEGKFHQGNMYVQVEMGKALTWALGDIVGQLSELNEGISKLVTRLTLGVPMV